VSQDIKGEGYPAVKKILQGACRALGCGSLLPPSVQEAAINSQIACHLQHRQPSLGNHAYGFDFEFS
jgi:hypothetical protein